jgi:hypothetical protein
MSIFFLIFGRPCSDVVEYGPLRWYAQASERFGSWPHSDKGTYQDLARGMGPVRRAERAIGLPISLGLALLIHMLCRWQEKRTMRETEGAFRNSGQTSTGCSHAQKDRVSTAGLRCFRGVFGCPDADGEHNIGHLYCRCRGR